MKKCDELYKIDDVTKLEEEQAHRLFGAMMDGRIAKSNGEKYKRSSDYVKILKSFWHWHQKVNKKRG